MDKLKPAELNGDNYERWKTQKRIFLKAKEVWTVVEAGVPADEADDETSDGMKADNKAQSYIFNSLSPEIQDQVSHLITANAMWTRLEEIPTVARQIKC